MSTTSAPAAAAKSGTTSLREPGQCHAPATHSVAFQRKAHAQLTRARVEDLAARVYLPFGKAVPNG